MAIKLRPGSPAGADWAPTSGDDYAAERVARVIALRETVEEVVRRVLLGRRTDYLLEGGLEAVKEALWAAYEREFTVKLVDEKLVIEDGLARYTVSFKY